MSLKDWVKRLVGKQSDLRHRGTVLTYRAAFERSEAGRLVLADLLESTGILRRVETEEQRIQHNWGVWLLENLAATQGLNYQALVDAILHLTIPDEALKDEQ